MSGWLNAASFSSALPKGSFWEVTLKFWIRRYFRLAPIMYFHLIYVYAFFDFCDLKSIIGNFIFLGNCTNIYCIQPFWYINVLAQFLLFTPFWILLCNSVSYRMRIFLNLFGACVMWSVSDNI